MAFATFGRWSSSRKWRRSAIRGDGGQVIGQNAVRVLTDDGTEWEVMPPNRGTSRNLQEDRKVGSTPC